MKNIIEILKGILIGVANVIPGVSGGTLAIVMGIYDKLINAVTGIFKSPIKCIKEVWVYVIGIALGSAFSVVGVTYLLNKFPIFTTLLFVGLILGAIPLITSQVNSKKVQVQDILIFCMFVLLIVLLPFIGTATVTHSVISANWLIMVGIGFIAAITIVVPGVSGTMILMALGYYESIMSVSSELIQALVKLDFNVIYTDLLILFPFILGIIVGVILIAELIKWLLKKYTKTVHFAILGLVVSSPFPVILNLNLSKANISSLVSGLFALILGAIIANTVIKINKE